MNGYTALNNTPLATTKNIPLAIIAQDGGGKRRYTSAKEIND